MQIIKAENRGKPQDGSYKHRIFTNPVKILRFLNRTIWCDSCFKHTSKSFKNHFLVINHTLHNILLAGTCNVLKSPKARSIREDHSCKIVYIITSGFMKRAFGEFSKLNMKFPKNRRFSHDAAHFTSSSLRIIVLKTTKP